jgi:hypothetical protein
MAGVRRKAGTCRSRTMRSFGMFRQSRGISCLRLDSVGHVRRIAGDDPAQPRRDACAERQSFRHTQRTMAHTCPIYYRSMLLVEADPYLRKESLDAAEAAIARQREMIAAEDVGFWRNLRKGECNSVHCHPRYGVNRAMTVVADVTLATRSWTKCARTREPGLSRASNRSYHWRHRRSACARGNASLRKD